MKINCTNIPNAAYTYTFNKIHTNTAEHTYTTNFATQKHK